MEEILGREAEVERRLIYRGVEMSEQQIETGHVRDARTALAGMKRDVKFAIV